MAARFEEAVQLAEQAFLDEFARLVEHLAERISGAGDDGQPRVFRDSAVGNLARVLRPVPGAQRPVATPQLDALVERGAAGRPRRRRPGPARRRGRCASGWRPQLAQVRGVARRAAGRAAAAADPAPGGRRGAA